MIELPGTDADISHQSHLHGVARSWSMQLVLRASIKACLLPPIRTSRRRVEHFKARRFGGIIVVGDFKTGGKKVTTRLP
ncbi:hypothetical protein ACP70R_042142 [Stipagrostis hirtigluma subsp. patula]